MNCYSDITLHVCVCTCTLSFLLVKMNLWNWTPNFPHWFSGFHRQPLRVSVITGSWFCCAYNNPKLHVGTLVTQIFIGLMTSNKLNGAWKKSEWHLIDWKILLANCFWLLCTRKENLTWGQESLRAFFFFFLLLVGRIWKVNTVWLSDKLSEKRQMFFIHQGFCPRKFVLEAEDKSCCVQSWGLGRMGRGRGVLDVTWEI